MIRLYGKPYRYILEMNIFAPNDAETETELRMLSAVHNHIISNQSNKPNIVIVQDGLLGNFIMTASDEEIPFATFVQIAFSIGDRVADVLHLKMEQFRRVCPDLPVCCGKCLFSLLLPDDMTYEYEGVVVEKGIMKTGKITKAHLGGSHNSLIVYFCNMYGRERCEVFLNEVQYIANEFLFYHGFSIGVQDCLIASDVEQRIRDTVLKKMVETALYYESVRSQNILEAMVSNNLNNIRNACMKIAKDVLVEKQENNFLVTVESGAKGDYFNIIQIMAMLGQQNFDGQRIRPTLSLNKRTLPHYPEEIKDVGKMFESRGFIRNSFIHGLSPQEFWFHSITGREGITDTAMKSVTWETPIIIVDNGNYIYTTIGKWVDDLLDSELSNEHNTCLYDDQNMELMDLEHPVYIPTMDYDGNMSWGCVSAVTRHDPGDKLYNIVTESGREVTVTASKSLLVWDDDHNQFKERYTKDIKIGDFVPVCFDFESDPPNVFGGLFADLDIDDNDMFLGKVAGLTFRFGRISLSYPTTLDINLPLDGPNAKARIINVRDWLSANRIEYSMAYTENLTKASISIPINLFQENYFEEQLCLLPDVSDRCTHLLPSICSNSRSFILGFSYIMQDYVSVCDIYDSYLIQYLFSRIHDGCRLEMSADDKIYVKKMTNTDNDRRVKNNVFMDKIIKIEPRNPKKNEKVYDLTVPGTFNFGLANGLQVRDTSKSGYIQRRMVKIAEDVQVRYDGTVRNSANSILQYRYGYHGYDPSRSVITRSVESVDGKPEMFFADVEKHMQMLNTRFESKQNTCA